VVKPVIVVIGEGANLRFQVAGEEVVFRQETVIWGLMPSLDLALRLRVEG
jgi:hypothetical protein